MSRQGEAGFNTEAIVREHLSSMGLTVQKPVPDIGVDFEVRHPDLADQKVLIQVKGRGKQQRNKRYRWFQIRTTSRQREAAVSSRLPLSDAWRKKVDLCDFFIFVSEEHGECWVFPKEVVYEIVSINRKKYGSRTDNLSGRQAEMDLDIEHEGMRLTERYSMYRDNLQLIAERFSGARRESSSRWPSCYQRVNLQGESMPQTEMVPAWKKAGYTDRWTEILFRALASRVARRWRFVSFRGTGGREWQGVVDVLAIRKDTAHSDHYLLKSGDLFEIVLVQMKGGSAQRPNETAIRRLRAVAKRYGAKDVVLFEWKKGKGCAFSRLGGGTEWVASSAKEIFG